MKELFYSQSEKILFWVAGYSWDLNTSSYSEIIKSLTENATKLLDRVNSTEINHSIDDIHTSEITESSSYKRMRLFWVETNVIPTDAYRLGSDWTMWKWLTN